MPQWLSEADCKAVLQSLLSAELAVYRGTSAPNWQDTPTIDSLERLHLAACVNEFFCLHETGAEDRLLMTQNFDDWATLVVRTITETSGLTFRTSGSTGSPSAHLHRWKDIEAEAHALIQRFASRVPIHRVISWLPLHHLYGFMLGVALPAVSGIPRISVDNAALPTLSAGDLVVTVPPRWDYLARSRNGWPASVVGVSSTAPLSADTSDALIASELTGLLEIYGSTETGGVATRWQQDEPYRLLSHWQRVDTQHIQRVNSHTATPSLATPLLDSTQWHDEHTFTLQGRRDDVVTIGGVNVSPLYVAERLRALESVAECSVRTTGPATKRRLKAFVVPVNNEQEAANAIAQSIVQWPAAERPVGVTYGDALPTNEMGKLTDW
ncbi:AMP-binding protein [Halomonas sp. SpR1]|uniref:AMP-binding protein n=1 Tax=Halomonas sp. SpR1 TaxID=3050462 RepID=UPI0027E5031B|nr:AMP-binding protein [Halomonas sp. SpR1]MDQ7732415.1 AMP-binding protein [Halomonas sp. SpR1]